MAQILVVDDDDSVRETMRQILERAGHAVFGVEDGGSAVRFLRDTAVDLVITDLYMPETDGIELIGRLRREGGAPRIIAMSGGGRVGPADVLAMASLLGANRAVTKPFTPDQLTSLVEEVLGTSGDSVVPRSGD